MRKVHITSSCLYLSYYSMHCDISWCFLAFALKAIGYIINRERSIAPWPCYASLCFPSTLLAFIALSAAQWSAQTRIHNTILVIDTSNIAQYNRVHWLVGMPHLSIKARNIGINITLCGGHSQPFKLTWQNNGYQSMTMKWPWEFRKWGELDSLGFPFEKKKTTTKTRNVTWIQNRNQIRTLNSFFEPWTEYIFQTLH